MQNFKSFAQHTTDIKVKVKKTAKNAFFRFFKTIKIYQIKVVFEVDLHDIRKNTNPILQKTGVHFLRYLTPNMAMSSFFKIFLTTIQ